MQPLGLSEGIDAIRRGANSSARWTQTCLERIAALEPRVQAFAWLDPVRARAHAEALDRAPDALLRGAPLGIKDIFDTAGIPTRMGSAAYAEHVPAESAAVVQRLERAGAFVLGKTVTAELAYLTPGPTRNPWNAAHTPGGSSSGSAAAVAAGFAPAALGTQTNGSVVRPAAFCGCIGFKPSFGRVPREGVLSFSATLDHVGFFARSVADVALLLRACADSAEHAVPARDGAPPRLLAVRSPVWERAEPHAREHFARTLDALRAAGAQVVERELPAEFAEGHAVQRTIMYAEGARSFAGLRRTHAPLLSAQIRALIDEGAALDGARLESARSRRLALIASLRAFLEGSDAIVTPPATGEAPASLDTTGDPVFCTLWTLCGAPALTLPSGRGPRGLPLGTQLVGHAHGDEDLLATARWCERVLCPALPPPPIG